MTLKRIKFVCEFLTEQMNHWMLFPLALTAMGMNRGLTGAQKPDVWLWLLCSLIPFAFFWIRKYCDRKRSFLRFLLFHGAAATAMALVLLSLPVYTPSFINKMLCVLCPALYMAYSLILYIKRETVYTSAMQPFAAVALSLGASIFRQTENWWNAYYSVSLICSLTLFALVFYMQHYLDFLSVSKNSLGYLPVSEIFRSGMGLVAGYELFGMGLLLFSTQFAWVTKILNTLGELALKFLHWLKSILPGGKTEELDEIPIEGLDMGNVSGPFQQRETFWGWKLLEVLFFGVLLMLLLFAAIKLLQQLVRLLEAYLKRRASTPPMEEEVFDLHEKCDTEKNIRKRTYNIPIALTYREQVRRLYKRRVLSASAEKRQERRRMGFRTAREWESELHTRGMADIYEQARYSEREINAADVKRMKEACKL